MVNIFSFLHLLLHTRNMIFFISFNRIWVNFRDSFEEFSKIEKSKMAAFWWSRRYSQEKWCHQSSPVRAALLWRNIGRLAFAFIDLMPPIPGQISIPLLSILSLQKEVSIIMRNIDYFDISQYRSYELQQKVGRISPSLCMSSKTNFLSVTYHVLNVLTQNQYFIPAHVCASDSLLN